MCVPGRADRCNGVALRPADAVEETTQTIGVEMDTLTTPKPWPKLQFELREIGGVMVQLWPQYYDDAAMLLYVLDVSQTTQVSGAAVELFHTLGAPAMRDTPTLLLLNKTDLPSGFSRERVDKLLRLPELQRSRPNVTVLEGSATTGTGVDEILSWMVEHHARLHSAAA